MPDRCWFSEMLITSYMTYNEVRLTVGMASDELSDTYLASPVLANALSLAMSSITPNDNMPSTGTLKARFDIVAAITEASRTVTEQRFYDLCRIYFIYAVANEVCVSLGSKLPKVKADGKASLTRFSPESVYKDTVAAIADRFSSLAAVLTNFGSTETFVPTLMAVVSPDFDPVTGE